MLGFWPVAVAIGFCWGGRFRFGCFLLFLVGRVGWFSPWSGTDMNARTGRGQSNSLKAADGEESRGDW